MKLAALCLSLACSIASAGECPLEHIMTGSGPTALYFGAVPLDGLAMVGTAGYPDNAVLDGLIRSADTVCRVRHGEFVGLTRARVEKITSSAITLTAFLSDGRGGSIEYPVTLPLVK